MSTLYIDRKDIELRCAGSALEVYEPAGRRGSIPLAGLDRVVLHGRVRLSTSVIGALVEAGASIALLGGRRSRYLATCVGQVHNDVWRRLGQFDAYRNPVARVGWARELVKAKISAQQRLLRRAMESRPSQRRALFAAIRRLDAALESASSCTELTLARLLGIEGAAAAAYFSAYAGLFPPSLGFAGRRRRPPPDPVNACLSFAYTLLHYEAVSAAHAAGLDPMLGLYHQPAYGRESFAADVIEPFRPHVDEWVWEQFRERTFTNQSFRREGEAVLLGKPARRRFYEHFNPFNETMRRLLRREMRRVAREFVQHGKALEATV